jgi:hypothetical protein
MNWFAGSTNSAGRWTFVSFRYFYGDAYLEGELKTQILHSFSILDVMVIGLDCEYADLRI